MGSKITKALHEVMSKVGYVQKTGKNQFHGYRYAGEADLLDKLRPAMVEAGLLLIPSGKEVTGPDEHGNVMVTMAYTLAHADGEVWPEKIMAFGCGNDRSPKAGTIGDKGVYKAITGANKYLLFKLFQVETGDDPENDNPSVAPKPAPAKPAAQKADGLIEYDSDDKAADADTYLHAARFAMRKCLTKESLRGWWRDEAANRASLLTHDDAQVLRAEMVELAATMTES